MEGDAQKPEEEVARPVDGIPSPLPEGEGPAVAAPAPPRRRAPFPAVTIGLILANGAVHLLVARQAGVSPTFSAFIGGASPQAAEAWSGALELLGWKDDARILDGEYWRLITAAFLHGGILHLCCNMIGLWSLGQLVEMVYGWRRFLFLYVGSAIAGSLGSMIGSDLKSVGASGAIFGLLGVGLVFSLRYRHQVPKGIGVYLFKQLLFWAVLLLGIGFAVRVIDNSGHIGGLLGGILLALLVSSRLAPPRRPALEAVVAMAGLAVSIAILLTGAVFLVRGAHEGRVEDPATGSMISLQRYDAASGHTLRVPADWRGAGTGPDLVRFEDKRGRLPMVIRITDGGEEIRGGSPDDLLARVQGEPGGAEPISPPERVRHPVGEGYRISVKVVRGEILIETRYYLARGRFLHVLVFRDAIVPPELREAILRSLRWGR